MPAHSPANLPPFTPPARRADLFAWLSALAIPSKTYEHPPVFTVDESRHLKVQWAGGHSKNLFLKDKKGSLFLISAKDETEIPLKGLHHHLGCGRLSFANADLLNEALGVTPGAVTAFALMNDRAGRVRFILDAALAACDPVHFHPLENTATTAVAPGDLLRFARATGHAVEVMDFAALSRVG